MAIPEEYYSDDFSGDYLPDEYSPGEYSPGELPPGDYFLPPAELPPAEYLPLEYWGPFTPPAELLPPPILSPGGTTAMVTEWVEVPEMVEVGTAGMETALGATVAAEGGIETAMATLGEGSAVIGMLGPGLAIVSGAVLLAGLVFGSLCAFDIPSVCKDKNVCQDPNLNWHSHWEHCVGQYHG
ncbi:hypothetical protein LTR37_015774 [Vermiconidia calcicola]|uniref:Uncharacterized protein n=1 Tax=Vermiconidia calcicola TaxID=1690605 RepID=A0ACC3MQJ5_9PEZI|nr:hypothetical protein LTR37_015774 [Vermiconidia calcicola]